MSDDKYDEESRPLGSYLSDVRAVYRTDPPIAERLQTRLSGKNQLTMPVSVTRLLGWEPGDTIEIRVSGEGVYMEKKLNRNEALRRLRGSLAGAWPNRESAERYAQAERASWEDEWDSDAAGAPATGN